MKRKMSFLIAGLLCLSLCLGAEAAGTVAACTPVPGGIGSVTTALLLLHTVQSAEIFRQF